VGHPNPLSASLLRYAYASLSACLHSLSTWLGCLAGVERAFRGWGTRISLALSDTFHMLQLTQQIAFLICKINAENLSVPRRATNDEQQKWNERRDMHISKLFIYKSHCENWKSTFGLQLKTLFVCMFALVLLGILWVFKIIKCHYKVKVGWPRKSVLISFFEAIPWPADESSSHLSVHLAHPFRHFLRGSWVKCFNFRTNVSNGNYLKNKINKVHDPGRSVNRLQGTSLSCRWVGNN